MVTLKFDPLKGKPFTRENITPEVMDAVFGTPEESAARSRVFNANMEKAWKARERFPGEYIAVIDCKVAFHSPRREEFREELERRGLYEREGLAIAPPIPPRS